METTFSFAGCARSTSGRLASATAPALSLPRFGWRSPRGTGVAFEAIFLTMPVTVILELKLKPDAVPAARDVMGRALKVTRAFEGNLGTDVLVDEDDEAHWVIYEVWESVEHDEAYRRFRATEGKITELPPLLAAPPVKTRYTTTDV